jgi:hypothetical protein
VSPDLRDTFTAMCSVIESKTECPLISNMEELGQIIRSCLMIGLRLTALIGDDEELDS